MQSLYVFGLVLLAAACSTVNCKDLSSELPSNADHPEEAIAIDFGRPVQPEEAIAISSGGFRQPEEAIAIDFDGFTFDKPKTEHKR